MWFCLCAMGEFQMLALDEGPKFLILSFSIETGDVIGVRQVTPILSRLLIPITSPQRASLVTHPGS